VAPAIVAAHAVLSWPAFAGLYCGQYAWRLRDIPVEAALRKIPEERFLSDRQPRYTLARAIERRVPPDGKVFMYGQTPNAYTSRELLVAYESAFGNLLSDILLAAVTLDEQPLWELEFRFPAQPVRRLRVVQTAGAGPGEWSVREMRVFRGQEELPRVPRWRLRAHPNPWDVQLAFDHTLVTRWRSWQPLLAGMYVEVDFGAAETVDAVRLECSPDQGDIRLRLEAATVTGQWRTLAQAYTTSERQRPDRLRRAAIEELKARGVDYLLLYDSDALAEQFRSRRRSWGLTLLEQVRGARLYRLD
jgi:hypothetical protein